MNAKRKILIVDDDPSIRLLVRAALERTGYEVTTARDGCEAIAAIARADYDMILLDVRMPKLDGLGVVDALRESRSDVLAHTYLLTDSDEHLKELGDVPVYGLIAKPFDVSTLVAETKDCIGH